MTHKVEYDKLYDNVVMMINLLEYDAMRSSGKMKMNSQHLHSLYFLKEKYELMKPKTPTKKEG